MKKLIKLKGKQIRLLLKVENSGHGFYSDVAYFLEDNEELLDEETVELEIREIELDDIVEMVNDYLNDNSIEEKYKPKEQEIPEFKELLTQLNSK